MKIIFMCVANSARSQLAEGLAKKIFGDKVEIQSAGSSPKTVNPLAIIVLKEIGIDISRSHSKSIDQLSPKFLVELNYIITLCAEEVCPIMPSRTGQKLHWPLPDPATHERLSHEIMLDRFRETRDNIRAKLLEFKNEVTLRAQVRLRIALPGHLDYCLAMYKKSLYS